MNFMNFASIFTFFLQRKKIYALKFGLVLKPGSGPWTQILKNLHHEKRWKQISHNIFY